MKDLTEFLAFARERRSVREFRPDPVPKEILRALIEAASWAPSAGNRQDWEFLTITSGDLKAEMENTVGECWRRVLAREDTGAVEELRKYAVNFEWFSRAPALIVVSAKRTESFMQHFLGEGAADVAGSKASAAMAAQNLMLAAHTAGLGSCCLTGPLAAQEELRKLLRLGKRREIVCLLALGYPADRPKAPRRKAVDEIARWME